MYKLNKGVKESYLINFIWDFLPFVLVFIIYSLLDQVIQNSQVIIAEVYRLELVIFGRFFNGQIPSFWFKDHQLPIITILASILYSMHFGVPIVVAFIIGYKTKNKDEYIRMRLSFLITTSLALLTFVFLPVAPPWYVDQYGFVQPQNFRRVAESAAGLLMFDQIFGISFFADFYAAYNATPYAAVPSLHSAFSFLTAIVFVDTYKSRSKKAYLFYLYPISIWFSAVYLQHHYIVDIIIAIIYVILSDVFVRLIIIPIYRHYDLSFSSIKTAFSHITDNQF